MTRRHFSLLTTYNNYQSDKTFAECFFIEIICKEDMTPYPIPHNKKQHTRKHIIATSINEQTNKMFCPRSLFWCITPTNMYYYLVHGFYSIQIHIRM